MPIPYTIQSTPKTTPISAKGLNENFNYLDKLSSGGVDVPVMPAGQGVYVLACQGGYMFWMKTEECE
tara:strand:+ start:86 stop:286 length:201 start_codon:yes stop_codon:yes gene_type:complete